jgi:Uncharacterized conserved protein (DUF2293)
MKDRVGLSSDITLSRRVQLAVLAHIRHTHTRYDELLTQTDWAHARKLVEPVCLDILVRWRGDEETGRDQLDEILREVIVISDSDSDLEDDDSGGDDEDDEGDSQEKSDLEEQPLAQTEPAIKSAGTSRRSRKPRKGATKAKKAVQKSKGTKTRRMLRRQAARWDEAVRRNLANSGGNAPALVQAQVPAPAPAPGMGRSVSHGSYPHRLELVDRTVSQPDYSLQYIHGNSNRSRDMQSGPRRDTLIDEYDPRAPLLPRMRVDAGAPRLPELSLAGNEPFYILNPPPPHRLLLRDPPRYDQVMPLDYGPPPARPMEVLRSPVGHQYQDLLVHSIEPHKPLSPMPGSEMRQDEVFAHRRVVSDDRSSHFRTSYRDAAPPQNSARTLMIEDAGMNPNQVAVRAHRDIRERLGLDDDCEILEIRQLPPRRQWVPVREEEMAPPEHMSRPRDGHGYAEPLTPQEYAPHPVIPRPVQVPVPVRPEARQRPSTVEPAIFVRRVENRRHVSHV